MLFFIRFIPILLFISLFVGSGIYFTLLGTPNAFYQFSPVTAIIPGIALAWVIHRGTIQQKMHDFLDGVRHRDIITMCIIFLLAGAFSEITKQIGSVDATVNLALSFIPTQFLLIGLFLVAAFISTSIGYIYGNYCNNCSHRICLESASWHISCFMRSYCRWRCNVWG